MLNYNPRNWYWIVGDHPAGFVFSSAAGNYVPLDDPAYRAWLATGKSPVPTSTEAGLIATLAARGIYADTKLGLIAYANAKQWALATGGYTATINGAKIAFPTDESSQQLIAAKVVRLQEANAPASINWQVPSGFVAIAAADFRTVATAIADFVQATFDALESVLAAINSGQIANREAVDIPPPGLRAWPANAS
jgi:hypothetical protein